MRRKITAGEGAADERLDVFLASELAISRAQAQKLLRQAQVTVNSSIERAGYRMHPGDKVDFELIEEASVEPDAPELPVVYEETELLIVDKPAGLTVHSGSGTAGRATVADFAKAHTTDPDAERPGIVHRLDRDTSGLLIIAKTAAAKRYLQKQFREHRVAKTYLLLVIGRPKPSEAVIKLPVGRHPSHGLRQTVVTNGRQAITSYRTLAAYPGFSLIEAAPETGRTHQLRVHFSALGHPVAGDTTYGPPKRPLGLRRQFLHAARLEFTGPTGTKIKVESKLPVDLEKTLQRLNENV